MKNFNSQTCITYMVNSSLSQVNLSTCNMKMTYWNSENISIGFALFSVHFNLCFLCILFSAISSCSILIVQCTLFSESHSLSLSLCFSFQAEYLCFSFQASILLYAFCYIVFYVHFLLCIQSYVSYLIVCISLHASYLMHPILCV